PSRCDPRPSRRTAATWPALELKRRRKWLRSSAVTEDGRHHAHHPHHRSGQPVAILGRHGGRPPPHQGQPWGPPTKGVAILGRHGGRPPPCASPASPQWPTSCDPRPSRRTAATPPRTALGPPNEGSCDPRPSRRTAATGYRLVGFRVLWAL